MTPMGRRVGLVVASALLCGRASLGADTVTLPVAASVVGIAPFLSDVRVFNTSYVSSVSVTAVYRFGLQPVMVFVLQPRESKSFDDICVSLFGVPNSLGAVEFTSSAPAGTVVVTSRLYSPVATGGAVGMFIPGLPSSSAKVVTVLSGLMNGASRTNVGVYNPNDVSVMATVRLFDGAVLLGAVSVPLGPKGGTQVSNIYRTVGFEMLVRTDGYVTVDSGNAAAPLFTYAAIADNATQDTILVVGAEDVAAPFGFNPPTPTRTPGGPTPTPSPPPSGTQTIQINVKAWDFSPGGPVSQALILKVGVSYRLVFHNIDAAGTTNPRHGFSGISDLGLTGTDNIERGRPDVVIPPMSSQPFTPKTFQVGNYPFACTNNDCGGDPQQHAGMLGFLIIQ